MLVVLVLNKGKRSPVNTNVALMIEGLVMLRYRGNRNYANASESAVKTLSDIPKFTLNNENLPFPVLSKERELSLTFSLNDMSGSCKQSFGTWPTDLFSQICFVYLPYPAKSRSSCCKCDHSNVNWGHRHFTKIVCAQSDFEIQSSKNKVFCPLFRLLCAQRIQSNSLSTMTKRKSRKRMARWKREGQTCRGGIYLRNRFKTERGGAEVGKINPLMIRLYNSNHSIIIIHHCHPSFSWVVRSQTAALFHTPISLSVPTLDDFFFFVSEITHGWWYLFSESGRLWVSEAWWWYDDVTKKKGKQTKTQWVWRREKCYFPYLSMASE